MLLYFIESVEGVVMNATHQYMFSKRKLDVCISFTDKYGIIKTINFLNDVVCLR